MMSVNSIQSTSFNFKQKTNSFSASPKELTALLGKMTPSTWEYKILRNLMIMRKRHSAADAFLDMRTIPQIKKFVNNTAKNLPFIYTEESIKIAKIKEGVDCFTKEAVTQQDPLLIHTAERRLFKFAKKFKRDYLPKSYNGEVNQTLNIIKKGRLLVFAENRMYNILHSQLVFNEVVNKPPKQMFMRKIKNFFSGKTN